MKKLRAGVLGAGHLGKIHLRLLQESDSYELMGFYDPDTTAAKALAEKEGYTTFGSIEELLASVDMVDIVTPTMVHLSNDNPMFKCRETCFY